MMIIPRRTNSKTLPLVALTVLAFAAASAAAQSSDKVLLLDIKPQSAGLALMTLSRTSGVQIMLGKEAGSKVEVEGLKGEYRFEEALAALLADTGLQYEFASENVVLVQQERDTQEEETQEEDAEAEEDQPLELAEQTVTGSRLIGGDPGARVYSFTAEQIYGRGVSSLEDFFRTIPWNFSSQNTQTGLMADGYYDAIGFHGSVDVGVSSINLRALGSRNTLVLLDGRRIAGVGGVEEDIVNLLDVPLSSIERVDIQLDGASAVYGADAIGGVVNFISKKKYEGLSVDVRQEFSSAGADTRRVAMSGGYGWGRGQVTASLSHSESKPVLNKKIGYSTTDLRPLLGADFDRRLVGWSQPGVVCVLNQFPQSRYSAYPPYHGCYTPYISGVPYDPVPVVYYQLPSGHSGENAQISDFSSFAASDRPRLEQALAHNGRRGSNQSLNLRAEQELTDDLSVFASLRWVNSDSYREMLRKPYTPFHIPASNAYNPFGVPVQVYYVPHYEFDNGLLPAPHQGSDDESRSIRVGFEWSLFGSHELMVDLNRTKYWRESADFYIEPDRTGTDPGAQAFYEALASPDPARAINPFGNGTAQGSAFDEFINSRYGPYEGVTETRQYNAVLRGSLFQMWGGPVSYSVGGEYRENIIHYQETKGFDFVEWLDDTQDVPDSSLNSVGVRRPTRETAAYYGEISFPFFGKKNARRGLRSLILTAQARFDVDDAVGSYGGREGVDVLGRYHYFDVFQDYALAYNEGLFERTGVNPNAKNERNTRMSPRLSIHYKPLDSLTFRAAWSRSYRPPIWSQRFNVTEPQRGGTFRGIDPFAPGGPRTFSWRDRIRTYYVWYAENLEPEFSTNWSGSLDWVSEVLPGLRLSLDWSAVDYNNRIVSSSNYVYEHPEFVLNMPEIAERDGEGNLTRINFQMINLHNKYNDMATAIAEYGFDTRLGVFTPAVQYTRYLEDYEQLAAEAPRDSNLGTQRGQDRYRWQFSLTWEWRNMRADAWVNYTPGYLNDRAHLCPFLPSQVTDENSLCEGSWLQTREYEYLTLDVRSLTTADVTFTYNLNNGLRVRFGGRNVLNRSFPRTVDGTRGYLPYDPSRWDARGRVLFVDVNWQM